MSQRNVSLARAHLIGGAIATGALAARSGAKYATAVPSSSATCSIVSTDPADRLVVSEIFSNKVFNGLNKQAPLEAFDLSPLIVRFNRGALLWWRTVPELRVRRWRALGHNFNLLAP